MENAILEIRVSPEAYERLMYHVHIEAWHCANQRSAGEMQIHYFDLQRNVLCGFPLWARLP